MHRSFAPSTPFTRFAPFTRFTPFTRFAVPFWLGVFAVLAVINIGPSAALAQHSQHLTASDVSIRATAPGMTMTGGYGTIMNKGDAPETLIAVHVDFAVKGEIHTMIHDNGVMKMRQMTGGLEVPAGEMAVLKPGDKHLMFIGVKQTLVPGTRFEVKLEFASGLTKIVTGHVKKPADIKVEGPDDRHSHGHSGSD
jgi:copper(I)-binding protein